MLQVSWDKKSIQDHLEFHCLGLEEYARLYVVPLLGLLKSLDKCRPDKDKIRLVKDRPRPIEDNLRSVFDESWFVQGNPTIDEDQTATQEI